MCGGYMIEFFREDQLPEEIIAQVACCHLYGNSTASSVTVRIEPPGVKGHFELPARVFEPYLVRIGRSAAQLKITMCNGDPETRILKQVKHDHRINAAAHRQKDFIRSFAEVMAVDMV